MTGVLAGDILEWAGAALNALPFSRFSEHEGNQRQFVTVRSGAGSRFVFWGTFDVEAHWSGVRGGEE